MKALFMSMLIVTVIVSNALSITLSGTVTNKSGIPLAGALVKLENRGAVAIADVNGKYIIDISSSVKNTLKSTFSGLKIINRTILLENIASTQFHAEIFSINGVLIDEVKIDNVQPGVHSIELPIPDEVDNLYIVRINTGNEISIWKCNGAYATLQNVISPHRMVSNQKFQAQTFLDMLRASKAGYLTSSKRVDFSNGVIDFVLDSLKGDHSTSAIDDGSYDRLIKYGITQYYWGTFLGKDRPVVKITSAASNDAVDIEIVFNPAFFDLTYGKNVIGWNRHTFGQLVGSDHVEIAAVNGNLDTIFSGKLDLISASKSTASGYACLGPYGGGENGEIYKGNPEDILSYGSSLDDNINYYGFRLFVDSPKTDSLYTPNPQYPEWVYYPVFRISLKRSAFGESGLGGVKMTYCHASPAKDDDNETVYVKEKLPPIPEENPWLEIIIVKPDPGVD